MTAVMKFLLIAIISLGAVSSVQSYVYCNDETKLECNCPPGMNCTWWDMMGATNGSLLYFFNNTVLYDKQNDNRLWGVKATSRGDLYYYPNISAHFKCFGGETTDEPVVVDQKVNVTCLSFSQNVTIAEGEEIELDCQNGTWLKDGDHYNGGLNKEDYLIDGEQTLSGEVNMNKTWSLACSKNVTGTSYIYVWHIACGTGVITVYKYPMYLRLLAVASAIMLTVLITLCCRFWCFAKEGTVL